MRMVVGSPLRFARGWGSNVDNESLLEGFIETASKDVVYESKGMGSSRLPSLRVVRPTLGVPKVHFHEQRVPNVV